MKEENVDVKLLEQKARYFFENSIPVHVEYKRNFWKNGYILSVGSDFFMLNEFIEREIPIFYLEVLDIKKFNEKEEVEA